MLGAGGWLAGRLGAAGGTDAAGFCPETPVTCCTETGGCVETGVAGVGDGDGAVGDGDGGAVGEDVGGFVGEGVGGVPVGDGTTVTATVAGVFAGTTGFVGVATFVGVGVGQPGRLGVFKHVGKITMIVGVIVGDGDGGTVGEGVGGFVGEGVGGGGVGDGVGGGGVGVR